VIFCRTEREEIYPQYSFISVTSWSNPGYAGSFGDTEQIDRAIICGNLLRGHISLPLFLWCLCDEYYSRDVDGFADLQSHFYDSRKLLLNGHFVSIFNLTTSSKFNSPICGRLSQILSSSSYSKCSPQNHLAYFAYSDFRNLLVNALTTK
jgi:hypothetical protein